MALAPRLPEILRFGTFEVDLRAGELRRQGKRIKLQDQPFQVLAVLLQRPGDVVTREELRSQIWPEDTFIDFDNSLNTAINKLREALGDSADNPRFIETLPRRGYRFLGSVSGLETDAQLERHREDKEGFDSHRFRRTIAVISVVAASLAAIGLYAFRLHGRILGGPQVVHMESLAVLPLTNFSGDPEQEYFADGMTDALITDLAQMSSVKVISRTSVSRYKKSAKPLPEIAHELNVDGIVEGTVQRSGNRVRITAQLIEGATDRHVWAQTYERDLRDVLTLQDEVARAIVGEIKLKVMAQDQIRKGAVRAVNPQAYEAYLRGLVYSRHEGVDSKRTSVDYFNRVIQLDPEWAEPHAQLARSYDWIAGTGGHPEFYPKARAAAMDAIRMDDSLAEAHTALAFSLFNYDWDWAGAAREYQRALQLNPNYSEAHHAYAELLMASGKNNEAVSEIERAEELDPLLPALRVNVGMVYSCVGRHDAAIEQLKNTTRLNPGYDVGYSGLGIAYLRKAMYPEAIANLEKALDMDKDDPDVILDVVDLAYGYAAAGRKSEARKMLSELEKAEAKGRSFGGEGLYPIYFALGEKVRGLAWLGRAYKDKSESLLYLRCWPEFNRLLDDPRFSDLVRRVGIPQ